MMEYILAFLPRAIIPQNIYAGKKKILNIESKLVVLLGTVYIIREHIDR